MKINVNRFTSKYLKTKIRSTFFRMVYSSSPWWNKDAVEIALKIIKANDLILEYGSGRSTIWFAKRCKSVVSIEHNEEWYNKIKSELAKNGLDKKVILKHLRLDNESQNNLIPYLNIKEIENEHGYDIVLIDGKFRGRSTLNSLPFLKKHGVIIIDDVHRYLPSNSVAYKINSRLPLEDEWCFVWEHIKDWREIRTTDGFHETSFFFKS